MDPTEFLVEIGPDEAQRFATLSGDWNPLHTDAEYASGTRFQRPILHGAYLAGLVSRMAGMHLPGRACLLHSMRLKFVSPVQPPVRIVVRGEVESDDGDAGVAAVTVQDADTGTLYATASYEFSRHEHAEQSASGSPNDDVPEHEGSTEAPVLVTGASGALGSAVVEALNGRGVGLSRSPSPQDLPDRIGGIVHCGWPKPDNQRLIDSTRSREAVEHQVAAPLRQTIALARLLAERGVPGATLVLIGSTAADPGRHNYRMPLYTISKGMVPILTRVLALELAPTDHKCVALTFDVIDGGMNEELSARARIMNEDRSPFGRIPTMSDAAAQIGWILTNPGFLSSGATIDVTGGAIP